MIKAREIDVARCRPSPTARALDPERVRALTDSIKLNAGGGDLIDGLRQPINVRPIGDRYEVRGGGHRLAAFRHLGLQTIPAFIRDEDDIHAEFAEIDENLCRNEFSPAERAAAMARRKAIYEELHPETALGGAGRGREKVRQVGEPNAIADRFTRATAETIGESERKVQREAHRGETIGETALAKIARTSLDRGEELDALAKLSPPRREAVIARILSGEKASARTELAKEKRERREAEIGAKPAAFPQRRFGLIYVDVPRHFNVHDDETGLGRSPENHYPTLSFYDLCALPVPSIAAADCILVYWSTAASLIDDLEIMAEWGFVTLRPRGPDGKLLREPEALVLDHLQGSGRYCSMQVWDKVRVGLGYWFRDRHEFILIGTRGKPVPPAPGTQDESLFAEPKGAHSAKPARVAAMIERLWPNTPKVELFQRGPARPSWSAWGNEAEQTKDIASVSVPSRHAVFPNAMPMPIASPPPLNDELEIPNFLRMGHPDTWRSATL